MNNTKTTKRALLSSVMAMLLCVAMLIGTTFAWFTSEASTTVNKIQAGKLDVLLATREAGEWNSVEGQTMKFTDANDNADILWEPGCEFKLPQLFVVNNGNLALKCKVALTGFEGDTKLLDALEIKAKMVMTSGSWLSATYTWDEFEALEFHLKPDGYLTFILSAKMKEEAGNEYQGLSIDGIGITVVATQDTVEKDSFDNQYDKDAPYPVVNAMVLSDPATKAEVMKEDPEDPDVGLHPVFEGKTYSVPGKTLVTADETFSRIDFVNANVTCDTLIDTTSSNTVMISDCSITLSEGGKLVVSTDPTVQVLIVGNVTVNGVKLTSANCGMGTELYNQYFQGIGTCFFY